MRATTVVGVLALWGTSCCLHHPLQVTPASPYCHTDQQSLRCDFNNTDHTVVVGAVDARLLTVMLQAASALNVSVTCRKLINIASSSNVTVVGTVAGGAATDITVPPRHHRSRGNRARGSYRKRVGSRNIRGNQENQCVGSVLINRSSVSSMTGVYGSLHVNTSSLSRLNASVDQVHLSHSRMVRLLNLQVQKQLTVHDMTVQHIASGGLVLRSGNDHSITDTILVVLEEKAVEVNGTRLALTDVTIMRAAHDAIMVGDAAVVSLDRVNVHHGSNTFIQLTGNGRVLLQNVTVGNVTVDRMEVVCSGRPMHPLMGVSGMVSTKQQQWFQGFAWYWLVVMIIVGLISGMVIGTAVMTQKPQLVQRPLLILGELLARDRGHEEDEVTLRTSLHRQDSGLTSSSFASFIPAENHRKSYMNADNLPASEPDSGQRQSTAIPGQNAAFNGVEMVSLQKAQVAST